MVSITSGVSSWYRPCYKNIIAENLPQYRSGFSLIVE